MASDDWVLGLAMVIAVGSTIPAGAHGLTERVSVGPGGVQGNQSSCARSRCATMSADGRFVAFQSAASNLVPGDTNGYQDDDNPSSDVFVRDRWTGTTRRVNLGPGGSQANLASERPVISADGRFVAFQSLATNLVPGDTNRHMDVFVRDRRTSITRRVSLGQGGVQGNGISFEAAISADGRFVAFWSHASNLVPGDTNGVADVFVRDRRTGTTRRVSLGQGGVQSNGMSFSSAISADGRFIAFNSVATNLVPDDTNGVADVFVRDCQRGTTERVNLGPGGVQGDGESFYQPAISGHGRFVAFESSATNLVPGDTNRTDDVFVRDRRAGTTRRVSLGSGGVQSDGGSGVPAISLDGRFVAFNSVATNLVAGDTNDDVDVFVRDRRARTTRRVSFGSGGVQGNGWSGDPAISADGRVVAFQSSATNLVPGDTNGETDVFVRARAP